MPVDEKAQPVVVAFDGSPEARHALEVAAGLFAGRRFLIVSVWEPGLAVLPTTYPDAIGVGYAYTAPSPEDVEMVDKAQHEHAEEVARSGAELARSKGATADPLPVPDSADVAETLCDVADEHDAAAIVVGSRGLGGVKRTLFGSTSKRLLDDTRRPILVVRLEDAEKS
jgi:nucleotide-binding universal stress UspA family protein